MRQAELAPINRKLKGIIKAKMRIAILGVGSELRSDDAVGLLTAQAVSKKIKNKNSDRIKIFLGETAPENLTGEIKIFKPELVVIIDAADTGLSAGSVIILEAHELSGHSFCTHQLPMAVLADYLTKSIKCSIVVIGIQPKSLHFGKPPSQEVRKTALQLSDLILSCLGS